ncbi:MAG: 50S ribosomal protein L11 [Candidatus Campbellbacteria bacterium]|nr:50S ribosomal protein L11 [Candidatus Campbellbacteria bacterium]
MKKVIRQVKIQLEGGKATAGPPAATVLGPLGINIGEFITKFNEATKESMGEVIPVVLSIYDDRSFTFITKISPVSRLLLKEIGKDKGSGKNLVTKAGRITKEQVKKIAEKKMEDLNTKDIEAASKIVEGTARSMGIEVSN